MASISILLPPTSIGHSLTQDDLHTMPDAVQRKVYDALNVLAQKDKEICEHIRNGLFVYSVYLLIFGVLEQRMFEVSQSLMQVTTQLAAIKQHRDELQN